MALSSANCLTQGHEDPDSDPSTHMKGQEKCLGLGDGGGESRKDPKLAGLPI